MYVCSLNPMCEIVSCHCAILDEKRLAIVMLQISGRVYAQANTLPTEKVQD